MPHGPICAIRHFNVIGGISQTNKQTTNIILVHLDVISPGNNEIDSTTTRRQMTGMYSYNMCNRGSSMCFSVCLTVFAQQQK